MQNTETFKKGLYVYNFRFKNKNMARIKIKTIYGKILTIKLDEEQIEGYISGTDKFGVFTKIKKTDIENSIPISGDEE